MSETMIFAANLLALIFITAIISSSVASVV